MKREKGKQSKNIEDVRDPAKRRIHNKKVELGEKVKTRIFNVDKADGYTDIMNGYSNTPLGINRKINRLKSHPVDKNPQKFTQVTPGKWTTK